MISGFEKLTLLDYPNHLSSIIYTKGCNLKCPFCHNSSLVLNKDLEEISESKIFDYLEKRKKILNGVVITGGEPLIHKNIEKLIIKIKNLGYDVKLDTNGTNPKLLKRLIDKDLIDYVAMDIKNVFDKYSSTTDSNIRIDNIKESIDIIKNSKIDYEFRTTIIKDFQDICDIREICNYIGKDSKYYLQNFKDGPDVIKQGLHSFTHEELLNMYDELSEFKNIIIRDIEMEKSYV